MKKKIGIYTITSFNYGNRLQNYALQTTLEKLGFDVYTVPSKSRPLFLKKLIPLLNIIRRKNTAWNRFSLLINWAPFTVMDTHSSKAEKFDYFIAGSDQIWNPNFPFVSDKYFLSFVSYEKRISYAASIGISELTEEQKRVFAPRFDMINKLSVRENSAVKIIEDCTGRTAQKVLDPTMLLSVDEWKKIAKKSRQKCPEKYIFVYFLGKKSERVIDYIETLKASTGAEVVEICNLKGRIDPINGPSEFVNYIMNSEFVVTDSFHCCVFSVLFHRQFVAFDRNSYENTGNMSSRLIDLFSELNINNRLVAADGIIPQKITEEEFLNTDRALDEKRKSSLEFLKTALEVNDNT